MQEEKCQVMFINTIHEASIEDEIMLDELQREISHCHWEIENQESDIYFVVSRKQSLYQMLRDSWQLIDNSK